MSQLDTDYTFSLDDDLQILNPKIIEYCINKLQDLKTHGYNYPLICGQGTGNHLRYEIPQGLVTECKVAKGQFIFMEKTFLNRIRFNTLREDDIYISSFADYIYESPFCQNSIRDTQCSLDIHSNCRQHIHRQSRNNAYEKYILKQYQLNLLNDFLPEIYKGVTENKTNDHYLPIYNYLLRETKNINVLTLDNGQRKTHNWQNISNQVVLDVEQATDSSIGFKQKFDVIIDSFYHHQELTSLDCLDKLWPHLNENGYYVIENLHNTSEFRNIKTSGITLLQLLSNYQHVFLSIDQNLIGGANEDNNLSNNHIFLIKKTLNNI